MMLIDARLPLRFGSLDSRESGEAVLTNGPPALAPAASFAMETDREQGAEAPSHEVGCACCVPRSGAGLALAALFRARAMGVGAAFRGVLAVVDPEGEVAVRAALLADPVVSGRYRLA